MSVNAARLAGSTSALSLGVALGIGLRMGHDRYGAAPLVLVSAMGLVAMGIGLARVIPEFGPWARRAAPWLGGGVLALTLQADSVALCAVGPLALGLTWGFAARSRRHAALSVIGALGLVMGFALPVYLFVLAATALTVLDLRPDDDLRRPPLRLGGVLPTLVIAGGAFLVVGCWNAARAALDPTAGGLVMVLLVAAVVAAVAALVPTAARRWCDPTGLGLACLAVLAALAALPYRAEVHVVPLAGVEDPRPYLLALLGLAGVPGGLAIGLGARRLQETGASQTLMWLALAAGALLGVHSGPETRDHALGIACLAGLATILVARQWLAKATGVLVWVGAAAVILGPLPWPEKEFLQSRAYILRTSEAPELEAARRERLEVAAGGWGPAGAISVETRGERFDRLSMDGFTVSSEGRAEAATRLAGHLGPALSSRSESALVLSDGVASVTPGLIAQGVASITVAVSDTGGLRALHEVAPERTGELLHPSIRLEAGPPERVLERVGEVDVLVEVSRTPWSDAWQGLPAAGALERRRDRLAPGGVYVLVVPLSWMTEGDLLGLFADLVEVFPDVRVFRSPEGADNVLVAGWAEEGVATWDRVVQAAMFGLDELILLDIRSPLDLADRALAGREALAELSAGAAREPTWRLGPVLHTRPQMLLPVLRDHVEGGDWLLGVDEATLEELELRAETNSCWLEVLASAAVGDFPAIFEGGRCLDRRNLDPLVEPHLQAAREALDQATIEGPGSMKWRDCLTHVSTVTMLHPTSAEAWAIAGRCRLVVDRTHARRDFERALEYDPAHLDALLGLALAQVRGGELGAAETTLRNATRHHNLEWRPHYHLGALLIDLGRYDEAEDELARAKAFAKDESSLPLVALAHVYLLQDRPNDAIFWAEAAVDQDETAKSLDMLGRTWLELDQVQVAERNFRKAILQDPDYWPAHGGLGRALAMQGDYEGAIESFERVLSLDPRNPIALESLARAKAMAEQP
ncbi:MAG TPA: tetratricopeptide repeat protein [Myxococcota bacterium]|nr:tetratricopeptide repeat protein [Myxococcota bacterium]